MSAKHIFSLYIPTLSSMISTVNTGGSVVLDDKAIVHRITHVLRLQPGDSVILFDHEQHMRGVVRVITKKLCIVDFEEKQNNKVLLPSVTFLLPLLKREALERSMYSLAELGANRIQLIITQKVQKKWGGAKEFERLQRILIAAAEQSKHFAFPELLAPIKLIDSPEFIHKHDVGIYFDPSGQSIVDVLQQIQKKQSSSIVLMVGPEGDITQDEKAFLLNEKFIFCSLTPTILRASQAVAVGLGCLRSIL